MTGPTSQGLRDPFFTAALLLAGQGMHAVELAERLQPLAQGDLQAALGRLEEMAQAGLLNTVRSDDGVSLYVPSELGQSYVEAVLEGQARLVEEIEALEKMRNELLAAIAHEFRTPLTAVRTAVGLLQDPEMPHGSSQEKRLLAAISQSAEVLQRLVTDFLDLARFRAGTISLETRRFEARKLAREAVDAMTSLFQERRQHVVFAQERSPVWVHGDRRRLLHALMNLLSNAHKFAPEGSTITVTTERHDGEVAWTVSDSGPGIPEETRDKLFERFFSMSRTDSGQAAGTGLGLPLVLATAQAHGGTVDVASTPGQGSSFTLHIPVNSDRQDELK